MVKTWPGKPYPLGATWLGNGVNFAIFSEHATGIDLCFFDDIGAVRSEAGPAFQRFEIVARPLC